MEWEQLRSWTHPLAVTRKQTGLHKLWCRLSRKSIITLRDDRPTTRPQVWRLCRLCWCPVLSCR